MKKRLKLSYIVGLLILLIASVTYAPGIETLGDTPYTFGAHRGSSINHIENTTAAIQEAVDNEQYKFIEFDIQYTKDKQIVVFHDLTLNRLQDIDREISELTYQELTDISEFEIPLYQDVMDIIGASKEINIEIKSQGNLKDDIELTDYVIQDVEERGIKDSIIMSSISADVVQYISKAYPEVPVGKIYWIIPLTYFPTQDMVQDFYANIEEMGADYVMMHGTNLRIYDKLAHLKPEGVELCFWYFDDRMFIVN